MLRATLSGRIQSCTQTDRGFSQDNLFLCRKKGTKWTQGDYFVNTIYRHQQTVLRIPPFTISQQQVPWQLGHADTSFPAVRCCRQCQWHGNIGNSIIKADIGRDGAGSLQSWRAVQVLQFCSAACSLWPNCSRYVPNSPAVATLMQETQADVLQ